MTYISATGGVSDGSKGHITVSGNTWTVVDDSHSHTEATISVSGFAASIHTHAQSDIINLPSTLAGYASTIHTHAQSDIADLPTTLAGYSTTTHTHTGVYEPADATILKDADIGVTVQGYTATLAATTGIFNTDDKVKLSNLSGTNTGDQTSIAGITGTKAQFDTAVTDGNFMYIGDAPTTHSHAISDTTGLQTALDNKLDDTQFVGLSKITVGTSAPGSPATGDLWVDTN